VRGPRPGETAPYRRFYDVPERIPLTDQPATADAVARYYAERYPGVATPSRLQPILAGALFGIRSDGSGADLHGDCGLTCKSSWPIRKTARADAGHPQWHSVRHHGDNFLGRTCGRGFSTDSVRFSLRRGSLYRL
jgi:hypothetical protein